MAAVYLDRNGNPIVGPLPNIPNLATSPNYGPVESTKQNRPGTGSPFDAAYNPAYPPTSAFTGGWGSAAMPPTVYQANGSSIGKQSSQLPQMAYSDPPFVNNPALSAANQMASTPPLPRARPSPPLSYQPTGPIPPLPAGADPWTGMRIGGSTPRPGYATGARAAPSKLPSSNAIVSGKAPAALGHLPIGGLLGLLLNGGIDMMNNRGPSSGAPPIFANQAPPGSPIANAFGGGSNSNGPGSGSYAGQLNGTNMGLPPSMNSQRWLTGY